MPTLDDGKRLWYNICMKQADHRLMVEKNRAVSEEQHNQSLLNFIEKYLKRGDKTDFISNKQLSCAFAEFLNRKHFDHIRNLKWDLLRLAEGMESKRRNDRGVSGYTLRKPGD